MGRPASTLADSPSAGARPSRPGGGWPGSAAAFLSAVFFGVAVAGLVAVGPTVDRRMIALVLALPLGAAALALAMIRFEWFLLGLVAVRPVLDLLHQGRGGGTSNPASIVGLVFVFSAGLWLLGRWRTGRVQPVSAMTRALFAMAGVFGVSALVSAHLTWSTTAEVRVIAGVLMFAVLEQMLPGRADLVIRLVWATLISAVIPVIIGAGQAVTSRHSSQFSNVSRVQGTFVHPNPFATYLLIIIALAIAFLPLVQGRQRALVAGLIAASGALLVLTYARAAWLAGLVVVAYLISRRRREVLWVLAALVICILVLVPSVTGRFADLRRHAPPALGVPSNSLSWRIEYWKSIIPLADRNPVTGIGLETVQLTTAVGLPPHNVFVQAYVETGVLGLAGLLVAIGTCAWQLRRRIRQASTPLELALGHAGVAIGLALLLQLFSENLMTETIPYWYFAVASGFGYRDLFTTGRPAGRHFRTQLLRG